MVDIRDEVKVRWSAAQRSQIDEDSFKCCLIFFLSHTLTQISCQDTFTILLQPDVMRKMFTPCIKSTFFSCFLQ